jgi:hypothetical protein
VPLLLLLLLQQDEIAGGGNGKQQTPPDQAELPPSYGQFLDAHVRRCVLAATATAIITLLLFKFWMHTCAGAYWLQQLQSRQQQQDYRFSLQGITQRRHSAILTCMHLQSPLTT